jgi:hypothetical protein
MLNHLPQPPFTEERLYSNAQAVELHINDDHYMRRFSPRDFVLDGVATHVQITAAAPQWPAVQFPDAASGIAVASWGKPAAWVTGRLRLRFWYTSSIGGTANFAINYRVRAIRDTEALPGTILTGNPVALNVAGPAVANTVIKSINYYTTVSLGSDDELFSVQVVRDGAADANNNPLHLLALEIEHIQGVTQAHV